VLSRCFPPFRILKGQRKLILEVPHENKIVASSASTQTPWIESNIHIAQPKNNHLFTSQTEQRKGR